MAIEFRPTTIWGLQELADREEQCRTWLSDGSSGEVSSFEEAICQVFESDIVRSIDRNELSEPLLQLFRHLQCLVHKVPTNILPRDTIDLPLMDEIRETAQKILAILEMQAEANE